MEDGIGMITERKEFNTYENGKALPSRSNLAVVMSFANQVHVLRVVAKLFNKLFPQFPQFVCFIIFCCNYYKLVCFLLFIVLISYQWLFIILYCCYVGCRECTRCAKMRIVSIFNGLHVLGFIFDALVWGVRY